MATDTQAEPIEPLHPLALIQQAIAKGVDADYMGKLMDLQERWTKARAIEEYNAAMSRVQAKMPTIVRDKLNTQTASRYARYESLNAITKPVYTAEGFSLNWTEGQPKEGGKEVHIICDVRHKAGHIVRHEGWFGLDDAGMKGTVNKTPVQAKGSTYSYGRRYIEKFIWNLAEGDEDNDGNEQQPTVTEDQAQEFERLIANGYKDNGAAFMKWLKESLKIDSVAKVPADKHKMIFDILTKAQPKKAAAPTQHAKGDSYEGA